MNDLLDEAKVDKVLMTDNNTLENDEENGRTSKLNKGHSTSKLFNNEVNRGLLSTLKKEKLSASSNMLRPSSL
jgi:hypothetical protein